MSGDVFAQGVRVLESQNTPFIPDRDVLNIESEGRHID